MRQADVWMSRATHVQPTDRNAITPIKLGVHTDAGAWVSNSSDVAKLKTPLPTNIQNVMTLMSILRPYLAVTAIWMAKKTAPAQCDDIADIELDAIERHQTNARQAQQRGAQVVTGKLFAA